MGRGEDAGYSHACLYVLGVLHFYLALKEIDLHYFTRAGECTNPKCASGGDSLTLGIYGCATLMGQFSKRFAATPDGSFYF